MKAATIICLAIALVSCGKSSTSPQSDRAAAALFSKYAQLDRKECEVLVKARAELSGVEVERSVLIGLSRQEAEQLERDELFYDRRACETDGVSPYIKRPADSEYSKGVPDASDIRAK